MIFLQRLSFINLSVFCSQLAHIREFVTLAKYVCCSFILTHKLFKVGQKEIANLQEIESSFLTLLITAACDGEFINYKLLEIGPAATA